MKMNDFYEVDGCIDFIPAKIVGKSEDRVIVTVSDDKQSCQLVVKEVYRLPKVHEPQKVVVPKFVAEWIKGMKQDKRPSHSVMSSLMNKTNHERTVWKGANMNFSEIVAQAWLDGYTVEKEPLYTVEIPNPNSAGGKLVLFKQQSTGRLILDMLNPNINKPKYLHLTESEIKQDFDFLWQFAKEVE